MKITITIEADDGETRTRAFRGDDLNDLAESAMNYVLADGDEDAEQAALDDEKETT